jgi:hypothetical protein
MFLRSCMRPLWSVPSCRARGTIMRCSECGTGCGSRGRGRRSHVPGRLLGYRVRRTTAPVGPGPVKGQSPGCRGGAPVGETHPYSASDPQATDQSRSNSGRPESNPGHASSRRAIPLARGTGKRDGRSRARPKPGAAERWLFDNRIDGMCGLPPFARPKASPVQGVTPGGHDRVGCFRFPFRAGTGNTPSTVPDVRRPHPSTVP